MPSQLVVVVVHQQTVHQVQVVQVELLGVGLLQHLLALLVQVVTAPLVDTRAMEMLLQVVVVVAIALEL
jgi:hypothetical protein